MSTTACRVCGHDDVDLRGCGACIGPKKDAGGPCPCGRGPVSRDVSAGYDRRAKAGEAARYEACCGLCAEEEETSR